MHCISLSIKEISIALTMRFIGAVALKLPFGHEKMRPKRSHGAPIRQG